MERTYDAVVIGSGMGGLAAACNLAKNGFKTVLLEQHNFPGGVTTSFKRGRFEFEISVQCITEYGSKENKGPIYQFLVDDLGIDIDFPRMTEGSVRRLDGFGEQMVVPLEKEELIRLSSSACRAASLRCGRIWIFATRCSPPSTISTTTTRQSSPWSSSSSTRHRCRRRADDKGSHRPFSYSQEGAGISGRVLDVYRTAHGRGGLPHIWNGDQLHGFRTRLRAKENHLRNLRKNGAAVCGTGRNAALQHARGENPRGKG